MSSDVTRLLLGWSNGDEQAAEELMPLVYGELRRRAGRYLRRERPDQTPQASKIAEERGRAQRERDQSEEVVAFLQDIFQQSDP